MSLAAWARAADGVAGMLSFGRRSAPGSSIEGSSRCFIAGARRLTVLRISSTSMGRLAGSRAVRVLERSGVLMSIGRGCAVLIRVGAVIVREAIAGTGAGISVGADRVGLFAAATVVWLAVMSHVRLLVWGASCHTDVGEGGGDGAGDVACCDLEAWSALVPPSSSL